MKKLILFLAVIVLGCSKTSKNKFEKCYVVQISNIPDKDIKDYVVNDKNGCVSYFKGSHKFKLLQHKKTSTLGFSQGIDILNIQYEDCLLYTSPSPRDATLSRMPSSA